MKIRAILRFRNEELTYRRLIAGFKTQKNLAEFLNISIGNITQWETFRSYPKNKEIIRNLECALDCTIDEIFPPEFIKAIKKKIGRPLQKVIDIKQLPENTRTELLLSSPEKAYEMKEMVNSIKDIFESLTEREAKILKLMFGLFESEGKNEACSVGEIAEILKLSSSRVGQVRNKALRKLKYIVRCRGHKLGSFCK